MKVIYFGFVFILMLLTFALVGNIPFFPVTEKIYLNWALAILFIPLLIGLIIK